MLQLTLSLEFSAQQSNRLWIMARDSVVVVVVDLRDHSRLGSLFPILLDAPFVDFGFALFWALMWSGSYPK